MGSSKPAIFIRRRKYAKSEDYVIKFKANNPNIDLNMRKKS
jgi:hypothetical protein